MFISYYAYLYFIKSIIIFDFTINVFNCLLFKYIILDSYFYNLINSLLVINSENFQIYLDLENSFLQMILCLLPVEFFVITQGWNFDSMVL